MKIIIAVIIVLLLIILFRKSENYKAVRHDPVLVLFRMKGCDACKKLMPDWNRLRELLRGKIRIMEFDAEKMPPGSGVTVFPTIKYYRSDPIKYPDDWVKYNGARTAPDIMNWAILQSQY